MVRYRINQVGDCMILERSRLLGRIQMVAMNTRPPRSLAAWDGGLKWGIAMVGMGHWPGHS